MCQSSYCKNKSGNFFHFDIEMSSQLLRKTILKKSSTICPQMMKNINVFASNGLFSKRFMASKTIKTPSMGESITEGTLTEWHKQIGDFVKRDEQVATVETDKIDVQVNSPEAGTITELFFKEGETVSVGGDLFKVELGEQTGEAQEPSQKVEPVVEKVKVEAKAAAPTPVSTPKPAPKPVSTPAPKPVPTPAPKPVVKAEATADDFPGYTIGSRTERAIKMNRMRLRIAERLKESQNVAASLTTFNEIDMT
jgi:2-oxoglutarate dehydrogenase E2 component (dihydrolipoamide succinyltransferase)